jgi:anti-anti-sigma factor
MDADEGLTAPVGLITIQHEAPDRRVLCLSGDVDTAVATRFTTEQGRTRTPVDAIDAAGVTFISSSGLAVLLLYAEASLAAGRNPVLRAVSPRVARALQLAGIDSVFPRPERTDATPPER